MQLHVILASFAATMVSVFPPPCGAMETLRNVQMAVMREDAVSCHASRIVHLYSTLYGVPLCHNNNYYVSCVNLYIFAVHL